MKKLGICLQDFGPNQISYEAIHEINKYKQYNPYIDIIGFYEHKYKPCLQPEFSIMHIVELLGYDGEIVATSLNTLDDCNSSSTIKDKYYYAWDLEWIHIEMKSSEKMRSVYCDKNLKIITRCEDYAKEIEKQWKKKVIGVVENFNIDKLIRVIENDKS